jgi:succinylglutamic semialdehyde dehydrogenase
MRGKTLERPKKGHYVTPSIHYSERWNNDSLFLQSEIFGPNVTFIPYDSIEEAIQSTLLIKTIINI